MKFVKKNRTPEKVPWKDGATLLVCPAYLQDVIADKQASNKDGENVEGKIGIAYVERSIVGWEGIVDENNKPIKFSEKLRRDIFELLLTDGETLKKVIVASGGALGNLTAGSTVSTNTDGVYHVAPNASDSARKKEDANMSSRTKK